MQEIPSRLIFGSLLPLFGVGLGALLDALDSQSEAGCASVGYSVGSSSIVPPQVSQRAA